MIPRLELRNIEARRFTKAFEKPAQGRIRIDHNSTVTMMESTGGDTATVEFSYTTSYGPAGVIKVDGTLVWQDAKAEEVAAAWSETRKMPNEVASEIHTAVMQACVPEAVGLAKNLRLPPPIPLPQVKFGDKGEAKAKAAGHGPEVA